ncbi:MAG: sugar phosphate isomerase/epimerase [Solobacterium sp.]|nr:sugar phosphate isomerase/epimerase [Solobacterium sp.]
MKTGIQQIMLGTVTGTETKAAQTLKRIKDAGYDGIELNRFMIHPSPLVVRVLTKAAGMPTGNSGKLDWQKLIKESGLLVLTLHADLGSLEQDLSGVVEDARAFGTDTVVITGMYRFAYNNENAVRELAKRLNTAGKELKQNGISLLYHNHNAELLRTESGRRAYDILIEETDPEYVNFEFDSYWFTDAGADAKMWMKKLGTRMKLWHVTDRGARQKGSCMTPILKEDSMELGTGNMDLKGMLDIARENGVQAAVLESHRNWIGKDPLRSMEVSAEWLKENL